MGMGDGYVGTRSVGAVSRRRTAEELRNLSEEAIGIANPESYRRAAVAAVQTGGMRVYIPAGNMTEEDLEGLFRHDMVIQSFGNTTGEPVYPQLGAANAGHNEDGTPHGGFLVVDVIARVVVDLVNRDGSTRLRTPLVRLATPDRVVIR